ncbi:MAG TPA: LLM class F420-dependent oxidoreductase [Dehalococcoidia bacterium]|jgi:probable F420-dependent oxidoreductase|nr:LLM class F420-dependent oxidoreductase [Dehalococcoidia bacterium]
MRLTAVLSQNEIGTDPGAIRHWVQALEDWGIDEIEASDHVIGADVSRWPEGAPPGFERVPHTIAEAFHEPLTLFAHLAAATSRIGFATSILILPQRQTVLLAKQAAEVDILSEGRLRLGLGAGWNYVEYEALGMPFRGRAARMEEQVRLLRALWTQPLVVFEGQWHHVDRAGLNPLPGRSIPIWIGGMSLAAIARAVAFGDGWVTSMGSRWAPAHLAPRAIARVNEALAAASRPRDTFKVSGWIWLAGRTPAEWAKDAAMWAELGVDQVGLVTEDAGAGPEPHLALVAQFLESAGDILKPESNASSKP